QNGLIRYNTDETALEVLMSGVWRQLRPREPENIVQQNFAGVPAAPDPSATYTNGIEVYFGPIVGYGGIPAISERHVMVHVDRVYQIPGIDYTLVNSGFVGSSPPYPNGKYLQFTTPPAAGVYVTVLHIGNS
ncbi:hypothetical protein EB118_22100, partial [bacterium]|nr:hypothetical protein [bacterium]